MQDIKTVRSAIDRWLYPDMARIAPHLRERAMRRARSEPFDFCEVCGLIAAIACVTYLTRYGLKDPAPVSRLSAAVANFVVAVPQLLLLAAPLLIRRNRRGLRAFCDEQGRRSP